MIQISGRTAHWNQIIKDISVSNDGNDILKALDSDPNIYRFHSLKDLENTIRIREHLMDSARKLNNSRASFTIIKETKANDRYWNVTEQGAMQLKPGVKPSDAIRDIYENGANYAFECAAAMVIVYYFAALNYLGTETFDRNFTDLYLYSWENDNDLGLHSVISRTPIPGDVVYFDNPDNLEPQWQGENAVYLGDDQYYGHGMGILSKQKMIEQLNLLGKSNEEDAYLTNQIVRPSFDHWTFLKYSRSDLRNVKRERKHINIIYHNLTSISYVYHCTLTGASTVKINIYGSLN